MTALKEFIELRAGLREAPIGNGGMDTCIALTETLDAALVELAGDLSEEPVSVLATGGYGRGEQCIYSDVDVTILHGGADLDALARRVLYPLWDAGLKVGHAFRTVGESNAAGKERLDNLTSQLSARLIVGSQDLFAEYVEGMTRTLSGTPLVPELASLEAERRRIDPYQVMAADLKKGRGALRTFQGFWWDRRRSGMLGLEVEAPLDEEREAFDTLLAIRNGLHAVAGRALDRYAFDARGPVAEWMSSDVTSISGRLCEALALGDRLAEQRWPGVLAPAEEQTSGRRFFAKLRPKPEPIVTGTLETAVTLIDRPDQARMAIHTDPATGPGWPESERNAFVSLIGSGQSGRMAFVKLQEAGWVQREFPEWQPVIALPQLAPFHEHPADAHLWRTADEMGVLLEDSDPFKAELIAGLGADDELILAAFLHDIGKGRGGDHSVLGAEAAEQFLTRVGFGPIVTRTVAESIRHHLLLIRTATRKDIAAPEVIDDVADKVGDVRLLQMLYLLTIADNKATGQHMWSDWKETLLTQLYMRTAERLTGASAGSRAPAGEIAGLSVGQFSEEVVEAHLEKLPEDYVEIMSSSDIAWHLDNVEKLSEDHTSLSIDQSGHRVLAMGRDRRGFLLAVCRAFAAHGVGIRDARIYTRSDGIAIDTFDVLDDRNGEAVTPQVWPKVAHTLEEIEASGLDVTTTVRQRAQAYETKATSAVAVTIRHDLSVKHLAVEVRSPDRIGLLADLIAALYSEGLDLKLARIDTRGSEAIDVLYLDRASVPKTAGELDALCRRLEDSITSVDS
ncbi:MAG: HD domain-containing protein [Actinomycetota bacterium]|nr:HD domain-containing protein [Actinomycetota bacterium]